ncbi:MAG: TatD family hydrolase [Deltaproteobacteria bacterium]|jgi:TatD DNase family protein|nr:TatD family hydrolase [Deltaproteobacteria bacterium]MBT6492105.1 TatD family hydrolase [Deltaproteobacteria bacterium]
MHMFVDSMAHLTDTRISDISMLLERAHAVGITHVIHAGIDPYDDPLLPAGLPASPKILKAFGIHPMAVGRRSLSQQLQQLEQRASEKGMVAIGEIGLDRREGMPNISLQLEAFKEQLQLAHQLQLPVIIHCVKATGLLLNALQETGCVKDIAGVWHGYSGSPDLVSQIENTGLHISIGGMVTNEKAKNCQRSAARISPERLLIESDTPDHAPLGWPSKLSEPAALETTVKKLSELRQESVEVIKNHTSHNAQLLFNLKEFT